KHVSSRGVLARHVALRALRGIRRTDDLLHLPEALDPRTVGAIRILVALVPAAFFLDENVRAWLHLKIVGLSLVHGLSNESSYGFSGYGTLLISRFHKIAEGAAFGRLALAMNERFKKDH